MIGFLKGRTAGSLEPKLRHSFVDGLRFPG